MVEQSGSYGQYDLLRPFGHGQVTEVFLAREKGATGPRSLLVVHRVLASLVQNTSFVEAFLNEAGVAGTLKHPNFVELYDLGELEGQHFVAEEYVAGGSLHELLDRRGEEILPLEVSLFIVGEVCAGLQFAHALAGPDGVPRNLVHKAINPRHILVSVDGVVKISDFSMSSALELLGVAPPGPPEESEAYQALEKREKSNVDRRADIYSSGALLYRLVTGELPRVNEEGELIPPREIEPDLPELVEKMILKSMSTNPRERHPTCGALRRDISSAVESLELQADLASLSTIVRSEFPEVSVKEEESSEDAKGADAPSDLDATKPIPPTAIVSARPQTFPEPSIPTEKEKTAETSGGSGEGDVVPFLDEDDFIEDATERLPGLTSMDQVDAILAVQPQLSPPQPEQTKPRRSIWIWVALATFIGAFIATGVGLAVVLYVWQPWSDNLSFWASPEPYTPPPTSSVLPQESFSQTPSDASPTSLTGSVVAGGGVPEEPKPPDQEPSKAQPVSHDLTAPRGTQDPREPQDTSDTRGSQDTRDTRDSRDTRDTRTDERPTSQDSSKHPSSDDRNGGTRSQERNGSTSSSEERSPSRSGEGFLYVLTRPTSRVYMDSRLLGTTPIMKRTVPAGRHTLVLVSPGHESKRMPVTVRPGQATQVRHLFQ